MSRRNTAEDIWRKVVKTPTCWVWQAGKDSHGYGIISVKNRLTRTHRISWVLAYGSIPDGMDVLHKCDNPACVNPEHLFLGTDQDNATDRNSKERQARGESHGKAVLTEVDVRIIRKLLREGMTQLNLARMFDCSKGAIDAIAQRRSWKHVL